MDGVVDADLIDLTAAQRAMWFAENLDDEHSITVAHYLDITEDGRAFDHALFRRAVLEGSRSLETAYTRIVEVDGIPKQFIDAAAPFDVVDVDLRDATDPVAAAQAWMAADHQRPMSLTDDPVAVSAFLRVADDRTFWYLRGHHIAFDGYGALVGLHEAVGRYNALLAAGAEHVAPRRASIAEVVADDAAYRRSTRFRTDAEHWAVRAADLPERVSLAAHPTAGRLTNGTRVAAAHLDERLERGLRRCANDLGASVAAVLTGAFAAYLARMTGTDDVVLSLPVTARTTARVKFSAGMVSNMLPLRIDRAGAATCATIIGAVTTEITAGLRHQRFRSEDIRAAAGFGDTTGTAFGPLVNLLLFDRPIDIEGASVGYHMLSAGIVEDLALNVFAAGPDAPFEVGLHANPTLYGQGELDRHRRRLLHVVEQFVSDPELPIADLDLLLPGEAAELADRGRGTATTVAEEHVLAGFDRQVALTPSAPALNFRDTDLTYRGFAHAVDRFAGLLRDRGVAPGTRVVVELDRSPEQVAAIYATLRLGAAYVPLHPEEPAERRAAIVGAVAPSVIVDRAFVIEAEVDVLAWGSASVIPRTGAPLAAVSAASPAYVIFTSGSTGTPKGVEIGHHALTQRLSWMADQHPIDSRDAVLYKTPATFDVSVWELLWPLRTGARMVIAEPEGHRDPEYLSRVISSAGVTVLHFVPSMLDTYLDVVLADGATDALPSHVRWVFTSGEALSGVVAERLRSSSSAMLVNLYGPTEAAIDVTGHRVTGEHASVPIGRPVPNTGVRVLDGRLRPVPTGVAGELHLLGPQLANAYVDAAALTAGRFVADPLGADGARMYRTGDLVRWTDDGLLEYLGRTDHQIKIRGQRVELGEIEAVVEAHPSVDSAAVIVRADLGSSPAVVAYVRSADPTVGAADSRDALTADSVLSWCRRRLPGHMVPVAVVVLDRFPTTRSGKLDQRALPLPQVADEQRPFRSAVTPIEESIAALVGEALGLDRVSMSDNLFALGADSLAAARMVARARVDHGLTVVLTDVFDSDDLAELAARARPIAGAHALDAPARRRPDRIPLSQTQTRLWFLNRMAPGESTYNMSGAVRLTQPLDRAALRAATVDVLTRHETLRTVFPSVDGEPEQRILDPTQAIAVMDAASIPIGHLDTGDAEGAVAGLSAVGFDLAEQIPFRVHGVDDGPGADAGDVVVVVVHHIAADGHSLGPLMRDLMYAYESRRSGRPPGFTPLSTQYADIALDWADTLGTPDRPSQAVVDGLAFWRAELHGAPELLQLPTDRPRPRVISTEGAHLDVGLGADLTTGIRALAMEAHATVFAVFQSAVALTLGRLGSTDDVTIGTAVAGRDHPAAADLVGMFVNTVVLRTRITPESTVRDFIATAHRRSAHALSHADIPFERIVDALAPQRSPSHSPLFQVALTVAPDVVTELRRWPGTAEVLDARVPAAKYDLTFSVVDRTDIFEIEVSYATDLFDPTGVEEIADRLRFVLAQMVATPASRIAAIDLVTPEELSASTSDSRSATPETTLADLVATGMAAGDPHVPALTGEVALSRADLTVTTTQLAHALIDEGVGPGDVVAVSIPRSHRSIVAQLAVAMTGAAFVPIDPRLPVVRRADMVSDSGARLVLTLAADPGHGDLGVPAWTLDDLESELRFAGRPTRPVRPVDRRRPIHVDDAAYLVFTSGTTGQPKAAVVTHAGLAALVAEQRRLLGVTSASRVLHVAAPGFDVAVFELILAVCSGAQLVISPADVYAGPALEAVIARHRVTHAVMTPTALATLDPAAVATVEVMMTAGEACPPELVDRWDRPGVRLLNMYGPAEATIWDTVSAPLRSGCPVTLGGPIDGIGMRILDPGLRPVPDGVIGELHLTGRALARGYQSRRGLTATRFVADPFRSGERMYRTGDLVSRTVDGSLVYHGRNDFQIKLRGMRVEPAEIDAVLAAHPDVDAAVSVGAPTPSGDVVLVSYVVAVPGSSPAPEQIVDHAVAHLPAHLVPHTVRVLDSFPLTITGKVDRRALPAVEISPAREYVAPRSRMETVVARVFADVLGLREVSVHDGFFELGGNSLSATKVTYRVEQQIDRRVPLAVLFENPTVASFVAALRDVQGGSTRMLTPRPRSHIVELSGVQRGLWSLNQADPTSPVYNIGLTLEIDGDLDVAAMTGALGDLIGRHESLRTRYPLHEGMPVQVITPPDDAVRAFAVPVRPVAEADLDAAVTAVVEPGFDLTVTCAVRAEILAVNPDRHVLVFVIHHINADGASLAPLARDLVVAYGARTSRRAHGLTHPPRIQFADYVLWHADRLAERGDDGRTEQERQLEYWGRRLAGAPSSSTIPADRRRTDGPVHAGGLVEIDIPAETATMVEQLARVNNSTVFVVLHAALAVLLARLSGRDDVVVGTPFAGRDDPALDAMVGMLATTIPLRTRMRFDEPFDDLLRRVRTEDVADLAHSDVSFDQIVDHLARAGGPVSRSAGRNPLFGVMMSFQNLELPTIELDGLRVSPRPPRSIPAKVDLEFLIFPGDSDGVQRRGALGGRVVYDTDLFDRITVERIVARYRLLLADIVADPTRAVGDLMVWLPEESRSGPGVSDDSADPDDPRPLHELVSHAAALEPGTLVETDSAVADLADIEATAVAMTLSVPDEDPAEGLVIAVTTLLQDTGSDVDDLLARVRAAALSVIAAHGGSPTVTRNRVEPA
ncbi:putative non-ribosomal peptide synthetase [Gordonia soli NBRC 108243]|uniref:Putative non-ribosomal peptide synthetase n=1 Tax=Gordonia soli NBRC 108243 TaxID=1223545 RepID=M0QS96_9ACTN|nr:putative non-ribosomal peptide synthetase [Gordonia soli NBRC 108243]